MRINEKQFKYLMSGVIVFSSFQQLLVFNSNAPNKQTMFTPIVIN
jgi:hypothetical protein